jgi:hypothetical protein
MLKLKLELLLRKLYFACIIFYAFALAIYLSPVLSYILFELYMGLPILAPIAIMYYCTVDALTPNPKHNSLYGWFYAELLEHMFLPVTMILILTAIPPIFMLIFLFLIYYFYGHMLGKIKTFRDAIKISALMVLMLAISFYPDITFFVNVWTGVGYIFIIATLALTAGAYFTYNLITPVEGRNSLEIYNSKCKHFLKGFSILILSTIVSTFVLKLSGA